MTLDHRGQDLEPVRTGLSTLLLPLQHLVDLPDAAGEWVSGVFASRGTLARENERLRREHLELKAQLQKLTALEHENDRLRRLLRSSQKVRERVLVAELLNVDLDPYKHLVILDKGSISDAYVGQPVLDADGVMGQLVHVGPLSAQAVLITDPSHALPVQVARNGLRAIVAGTGQLNELEVQHLPNNADIRVGDLLVTSGLGGRFPVGYPVATVSEVHQDPGAAFATISARPAAKLDRSREVLLVWSGDVLEEALGNAAGPGETEEDAQP